MTRELFTEAESEAIERSLLLGLSRNALPSVAYGQSETPLPPLACLTLLAQRARFRRPAFAKDDMSRERLLSADERRPLMHALRDDFVRLLTSHGREASEIIAPAALRLLHQYGLRPHPFDLPRLDSILALARDQLGPTETAFLALRQPAKLLSQHIQPDRAIDEANWDEFAKPEKLAFIRALRATDPDRARHLIEGQLAAESAAMRAELIRVLAIRLSVADRDLLDSFDDDRATSVREAARELLQRVPGTAAYAERVAWLAGGFGLKQSGLLRRRTVLNFTPPAPRSDRERHLPLSEHFAGIRLSDLAQALKLELAELVDVLPDGEPELALALLRAALAEGLLELIPTLIERSMGLGPQSILLALADDLRRSAPTDRGIALRALITSRSPETFPDRPFWRVLADLFPDGLPPDLAQRVLDWKPWRAYLTAAGQTEPPNAARMGLVLAAFAVVVPASLAEIVVRDLEPLPPEVKGNALAYTRFVSALAAFCSSTAPLHQIKETNQ